MPNYNQSGSKNVKYSHGMNRTRLYRCWTSMKRRCMNENSIEYEYYGGRGIKVCSDWLLFIPFMVWAKNNGYQDNLTLDRIDLNKDYGPDNCRWATAMQQANNTSRNRKFLFRGSILSIAQISRIINQNQSTISKRLKLGWTLDEIATHEPKIGNNEKLRKGCSLTGK